MCIQRSFIISQTLSIIYLETLLSFNGDLCFVTYLTVEPNKEIIDHYVEDFYQKIIKDSNAHLAIMGPQQVHLDLANLPKNIHLFKTVDAFQQKFLEASIFV